MFGKRILGGALLVFAVGTFLTASLTGVVPLPWRSDSPTAEARTAVLSGGFYNPLPVPPGSHALATPPGTVNFQGLLTDPGTGNPVPDGPYSIRFSIWDAASGPTEVWNETQPTVAVAGGLFGVQLGSVTPLSGAAFNGTPRYLEVRVGADPAMTPRLPFDTVPYAFYALAADSANSAELLDGLASSDFWKLSGNSGTTAGTDFLGTTDAEPLELHVNDVRGLRLEPVPAGYGPNVVGGFSANSITSGARAATIGGGGNDPNGSNRVTDDYGTVSGGINNQAGDNAGNTFTVDSATVGGGNSNTASGNNSTVSGGKNNTASGGRATVGGGDGNTASGTQATVAGGGSNSASGTLATVGGGSGNIALNNQSTVGGGQSNTASNTYATVGGGLSNTASAERATVGGGSSNGASGFGAAVGGGQNNSASGFEASIGGGGTNSASGTNATVGGGHFNEAAASYATIAGGGESTPLNFATRNRVTDDYGTVGGGGNNQAGDAAGTTADRPFATVSGGKNNTARGGAATVGGGNINTASADNATVGGGAGNTASGFAATVAGGQFNTASADYGTIAGGGWSVSGNTATANRVTDDYGTVGGGGNNQAGDAAGLTTDRTYATVGGGLSDTASGQYATVGGGNVNTASALGATIAGGRFNTASNTDGTVGGGGANTASGLVATVGGGQGNIASGQRATVPGGFFNTAAGDFSFAAGFRANVSALHDGALLFADQNDFAFNSAAANEFAVRSTGGARFVSAIDGSGNPTAGVTLASGGGSWSSISDREAKAAFASVDGQQVLDLLAEMPIETWSYKSQDSSIRHIGPSAQDFYVAFAVGEDDKHITTVDADGVALVAIQGLYELVQEKDAQIAAQEERIEALEGAAGFDGAVSPPSSSGLPATWPLLGGLLLAGLVLASLVTVVLRRKVA